MNVRVGEYGTGVELRCDYEQQLFGRDKRDPTYLWCTLSDNPCFRDTGECDEWEGLLRELALEARGTIKKYCPTCESELSEQWHTYYSDTKQRMTKGILFYCPKHDALYQQYGGVLRKLYPNHKVYRSIA